MAEEIVNRVAKSGIVSLNLEELLPDTPVTAIDLKDQLWQEMILREKDFRDWVKQHDWDQYAGHYVGIYCSTDAIIPTWAYMLVASKLTGVAERVIQGDATVAAEAVVMDYINGIDPENYREARVVVKGCSEKAIPLAAYTALTEKLQPVVKTLLFGEPCSTVPVYKQPKKR